MGYPVNNQSKVPDLPERYRYQQTIPIEVSDNIESYDRHDPQTSAADPPKIPNLPERYRQQQQSVSVQGSNDARSSQRAGFQQTIPIQLSDNFDLPPSYETAVTRPQTASQPRETRSNSQSTTGSNAQPHHNLISSAPGVSQPPQCSRSPEAHGVDIKGYLKTDPMAWDEMERNGDWDKHAGEAGCCASTSGGCCFSSRGGCCFSDREGCCFSDRQGCCFSDRGGCCFSDTAGCCFSTRGAGCCSAGPGGP